MSEVNEVSINLDDIETALKSLKKIRKNMKLWKLEKLTVTLFDG